MTQQQTIINTARELIGRPYRHLGRGPFAFDCLGLVLAVFKATGLVAAEFDFTDYTQNVAEYELEQHLNASPYLERLSRWQDAQPGDVLLMRFHNSLPASHLVVITLRQAGALWGVHASRRGVVEQRLAHLERNRFAYRLKEVAHG